jgi:hypothetical protein
MGRIAIGLHVEGNADVDFLEPLVVRLANAVVEPGTILSTFRVGTRQRHPARVSKLLCDAYRQGAIGIACVHRDAGSRNRERQAGQDARAVCLEAERACSFPPDLCVPVVPLREIETWALGDQDALCAVFGVTRLPAGWSERIASAEAVEDPKRALAELDQAIRRGRRRLRPLRLLGESVSIDALGDLPSFRQFHEAFGRACRLALAT